MSSYGMVHGMVVVHGYGMVHSITSQFNSGYFLVVFLSGNCHLPSVR